MRCPAYLSLFKNLLRIIGAAMLVIGLQGCGALRLAYNQSPLATYWYLDGYLDFNSAQRPLVKAALDDIQQWHRQTQLPLYIETLEELQQQMPKDMSAAQACTIYTQVQERLVVTFEGIAGRLQSEGQSEGPGAGKSAGQGAGMQVLTSLDNTQMEHLKRKFARTNDKYRKDYVDGPTSKRREKRVEQVISRTESLYGNLTNQQEALIDARLEASGLDPETTYAERLRRQQDLLQTLRKMSQVSSANAPAELAGYLVRVTTSPNPNYRDYSQKTRLQGCQTFADLHNSMSPEQRLTASRKLQNYASDLRVLSRQR
jgi:hypothetical protein